MSLNRITKRQTLSGADSLLQSCEMNEMKSLFNSLLNPVLSQLSLLSEAVTTVLDTVNKKTLIESEKKVTCEYTNTTMATDVTMMASSIHRLAKNYESMKEQVMENQKNLDKLNSKLNNIEKLLRTLLKNGTSSKIQDDILERMVNLEQLLLCGVDFKSTSNSSSQTYTTNSKPYQVTASVGLDSSMQLITLNSEQDFPSGSWLGDVNSPTGRVRCPISQEDVIYLNTRCSSAEKMAVMLLDYLFPKETLAVSNLSGKSKLGKKQLDPLMVYGIKCHLIHHFNINEKQWERIKQNMDSKCRSAWKKRKLGEAEAEHFGIDPLSMCCDSRPKLIKDECLEGDPCGSSSGGAGGVMLSQVIHTLQGDIEVLHATSDQILRFQDLHNIHVLDADHILPVLNSDPDDPDNIISLSRAGVKADDENLTIITTDDADLSGADVSFVAEPLLLTEDSLSMDTGILIEEV